MRINGRRISHRIAAALAVAVLVWVSVILVGCAAKEVQGMESSFGRYRNDAERRYDGAKRTSTYLALADGTRLAYDLFLPTRKGVAAECRLPTLFKYTPYGRAWTIYSKNGKNNMAEIMPMSPVLYRLRVWLKGNVMDELSKTEWLGEMVESGYAVIVVERPGTSASFGQGMSWHPASAMRETNEILNWIAVQPWSDGNIGMFGDSIQAQIQFQAAATGNPHLKAILPATTWMDQYSAVMFPGGVLNTAMPEMYAKLNNVFEGGLATPVDGDQDGVLLAQAQAERGGKSQVAEAGKGSMKSEYRDSLDADGRNDWIETLALYPLLDKINRAGVPAYLINGWYDIYARDNFLIFANLTVPKRILVRPTDHSGIESPGKDIDYAAEAHRWFDYWLKGIDTGIMDEPPIHYYVQNSKGKGAWIACDRWPVEGPRSTLWFAGVNGIRTLSSQPPQEAGTTDLYTVDYSTGTGKKSHWIALATGHEYPDMKANDAKALTYTTEPLASDLTVAGHPIMRLRLSTSAPDLDVFAYLEEVDRSGKSRYITQGILRASHRALGQAPFDNLGLPWHDHFESSLRPVPANQPIELAFDLLPTAYRFSQGNRIRLAIACADSDNFGTPVLEPEPNVQVFRGGDRGSSLQLPIMP